MASSSLSQESLDKEELEYNARRSRIRAIRTRGISHKPYSTAGDCMDSQTAVDQVDSSYSGNMLGTPQTQGQDHESPTRSSSAAARLKEKRSRPNHLHKGKTAKDKRKLREKRRSTGVVHLPSTESTGDSLDEDEEKTTETKRNTSYNEIIDADNPQTPEDDRLSRVSRSHRNKSPSDLEADFEDNQDYDSTVSQSDTNLTLLGQASPSPQTSGLVNKFRNCRSPDSNNSSPRAAASSHREETFTRPVSYPSRFRDDPDFENLHLHATQNNHHLQATTQSRLHAHNSEGFHHHHYHHRPTLRDYRGSSLDSAESNSKLIARNKDLENQLEVERAEKRKIQEMLDERERRIAQLEREIQLLHTDLENVDDDNLKLQQENRVLLSAMKTLRLS